MTPAVLRKELAVLWGTPIPYVVGALFHAALGVLYVSDLRGRDQALFQPLVPIAGFLLLALVPLLTMRTFAEEASTGSLDVLQAIPVPARVLVPAKWLAAWLTTAVVLAPAGLFAVLLAWFGNPDSGPMLAGAVGLLLFAAAAVAAGVLASTCTRSQTVAATVTTFLLLVLWFAHLGGQRTVTRSWLDGVSISERLRSFAGGGIDSGDVAFFVAAAVGALALAATVVDARRAS